jgi:RNA polymerase sigma factor (sigma-70 family)
MQMTVKSRVEKATAVDADASLGSAKPSPEQIQAVLSHGLPSLRRYAHRLLGNQDDAEDAVQDALLAAFKHLSQFRGEARFSTWLTAIVINSVRMHLRKRLRHTHLSLDASLEEDHDYPLSDILVDNRPSPEDECHRSMLQSRLMSSAAQLSPILRKTFQLRFLNHLSIRETARLLGVPTGTVKAQTSRARAKLLKAMRGVLHQGGTQRRSCSRKRSHAQNPSLREVKPEAASLYLLTPTIPAGAIAP